MTLVCMKLLKLLFLTKIIELAHLEDIHVGCLFIYLEVNKLITDKTQKSFYLIAEYSGFRKFMLNELD